MNDLGGLITLIFILLIAGTIIFAAVGFYISWLLTSSIVYGILGAVVAVAVFLAHFIFSARR